MRYLGLTGLGALSYASYASVSTRVAKAQNASPAVSQQSFHALDERTATLKLVQIVFRHGARTPLSSKKDLWKGTRWDMCGEPFEAHSVRITTEDGTDDPVNKHNTKQVSNVLEGGGHAGQLTRFGHVQALEFGQWLRKRYVEHLGFLAANDSQPERLSARTTNFQRTIATLRGVLTGLFPGNMSEPIMVVTSNELDEILYADSRSCPHLATFMALSKEMSQKAISEDPEYEWATKEARRVLKLDDSYFEGKWVCTDIYDVMTAMAAAGKPLPEGYTPKLAQVMNRLAVKEFTPFIAPSIKDAHGHSVIKLSMGVLLKTMVENMDTAVIPSSSSSSSSSSSLSSSSSHPLIYMYSGHDSTIMPLLSAFGKESSEVWPPFLSNIILELWQLPQQEGGQHVVRVLYNRQELDIPHCPPGRYASLETFKEEVVGSFLMSKAEAQQACQVSFQHEGSLPTPDSQDQHKQQMGMHQGDE